MTAGGGPRGGERSDPAVLSFPPLLRLLRPLNGLISLTGTVIAGLSVVGLSTGHPGPTLLALCLAGLTTFLVTSAGNVLNDLLDADGDRVNHPDRPIPQGEVSPERARAYALLLFAVSPFPLLVFFPLGLLPEVTGLAFFGMAMVVWAASVGLLVGYEVRWKEQGILGNAVVALLTGAVFLFGATVVGRPLFALPWVAMAFFATLSREVIKDMEDMEGDTGRATLPRRHGLGSATLAGRASAGMAIALSPLPLLLWLPPSSLAGITYLALVLSSDLLFILSVLWLPQHLHREQGLSKVAMVLALGAFMGAALR